MICECVEKNKKFIKIKLKLKNKKNWKKTSGSQNCRSRGKIAPDSHLFQMLAEQPFISLALPLHGEKVVDLFIELCVPNPSAAHIINAQK